MVDKIITFPLLSLSYTAPFLVRVTMIVLRYLGIGGGNPLSFHYVVYQVIRHVPFQESNKDYQISSPKHIRKKSQEAIFRYKYSSTVIKADLHMLM